MRVTPCLLAAAVLLTGCTTAVAGSPAQPEVVGMTQSGDHLDVTLVSFVDPAPLYLANQYDRAPEDGTRLVAAQLRVRNTGDDDYLVDPTTEVSGTAGGKKADPFGEDTSAGVMLDQVSLAPGQTVLGYVTYDVPDGVRMSEVRYEPMGATPMIWQVAVGGKPQPPTPSPDARKGAHRQGEPTVIEADGARLSMSPTQVTDPASPQDKVLVGTGQHVVQVDFAVVENTGQQTMGDDPSLRIMTLFDAADESVQAQVYSMEASVEHPLTAGVPATWPVQFVAPDGFVPDHVSFRPEFGDTTTTTWALG
jgi:hypothetical protein